MERSELKALVRGLECAEPSGEFVFLRDPDSSSVEREAIEKLRAQSNSTSAETGWLCVRTGGTSGGVKFARHDERTLSAAVRGFCAHFDLGRVNAVSVLPRHHVSGFMAWLRTVLTGGEYRPWSWKDLEGGVCPTLSGDDWALSLVPTQLQRLLGSPRSVDWLRQFRILFVGGGPAWPALLAAARSAELRVSLTYGMTETAAMIAALKPEDFLAGDNSCGAAMPHAQLDLDDDGVVSVTSEAVFRGYFPELQMSPTFVTADLGRRDARGHLHLLGRRDALIITGGKKVQPAEVEAALRASGEFTDVIVIGMPDAEWGERVVACYPTSAKTPDLARAVASLASYQRPKQFIAIADWPRNAQGKIDRAALRETVRRLT